MDFELSDQEKAFRHEVRAWLSENKPADDLSVETGQRA
jgi:hypothetical protein